MRLDTEAITGLPCLEEALDFFRDAGLLSFVTDKEHWNEELLLHISVVAANVQSSIELKQ